GSGVLRFVENDEAVIQSASAHKCQRGNFNHVALNQLLHFLGVDHVEERVVERAQIGIDFFLQAARQESKPLARFDGGAREDNPAYPLVQVSGDGHRHRQIRFSGSRWTDAEGEIVMLDGIDITPLVDGLRRQNLLTEGARLAALHQSAQRHVRVADYHLHVAVQVAVVEDVAFADEVDIVGQNALRAAYLRLITFQLYGATIGQVGVKIELPLKQANVLVTGPEQSLYSAGDL